MMLNNNFDIENLLMEGNSAYYGGAVFVSADLSANATFNNLTFVNNVAAEGKQVTYFNENDYTCCHPADGGHQVCHEGHCHSGSIKSTTP